MSGCAYYRQSDLGGTGISLRPIFFGPSVYIDKQSDIYLNKGGCKCSGDFALADIQCGSNIFCRKQNAALFFGRQSILSVAFSPIVQNADATFTSTSFADLSSRRPDISAVTKFMGLPYRKGEVAMTRLTTYPTHDDVYEYFGGTTIQWTRRKADETVWQDWLLFDSIEAALEFFNEFCSA